MVLYQNEDGFIIEKDLGGIHHMAKKLSQAIMKYSLSEPPKIDELMKIAKTIQLYIGQNR